MKLKLKISDFLYPPKCVFCTKILWDEKWVCSSCQKEISYITVNTCNKCGRPIEENVELCFDCRNSENTFNNNCSPFLYEGSVRDAIRRFKYRRKPHYSKYFAKVIVGQFYNQIVGNDYLLGVPMHKSKLRSRGYNQADLLANEMSLLTDIPTLENTLIRKRKTKPQNNLNKQERFNNIKDAFLLNSTEMIAGKRIIIVDDIYTSGSTINECARMLYQGGAEEVNSATIAVVDS